MAKLYIVPTPIGNLDDITLRAVNVLREVDFILAEDTRTTSFLLKHLGIEQKLRSHHKFNEHATVEMVAGAIAAGRNAALVSDAGTPGISDRVPVGAHVRRGGDRGRDAARRHGADPGAGAERVSVRPFLLRGLPAPEEGADEAVAGACRRGAHDDFLRIALPRGPVSRAGSPRFSAKTAGFRCRARSPRSSSRPCAEPSPRCSGISARPNPRVSS